MNDLDPRVDRDPHRLIVQRGRGKAGRDRKSFDTPDPQDPMRPKDPLPS